MSLQVNEFRYIPGENDAEYIRLLKNALERQKQITAKAVDKIKELSKQRTGEWIWEGSSHRCSKCNEYTCFEDSKPPKFCPNCGTKMNRGKNEIE